MAVLQSLAVCDLTTILEVDSTDELGAMAVALNRTIEVLRGTLATITQSAEQLASASEEISAGAGQTAESSRVRSRPDAPGRYRDAGNVLDRAADL